MADRVARAILLVTAAVVALVVAIGIIAAVAPATPTAPSAIAACQRFVLQHLMAPKTATFPPDPAPEVFAPGPDGLGDDRDRRVVTGAVDAENGFGALLRVGYVCALRWQADGHWQLDEFHLSDE